MGSGGSRYGAGRPGWRRRCESMLSLDVRKLRRHGTLQPGTYAWGWNRDGEQYASVGIVVQVESLRLEYTRTPNGEEPRAMECTVRLERVPCRYGGERTYFACPDCGRRCERLYGLDRWGRFACRLCLRLGYASESESPEDRTWRRQRKLEARLDDEGGKPPGMRWRTFEKIVTAIDVQEDRRDDFTVPELLRFLARLDTGATSAAVGSKSPVEGLAEVHGAENGSR